MAYYGPGMRAASRLRVLGPGACRCSGWASPFWVLQWTRQRLVGTCWRSSRRWAHREPCQPSARGEPEPLQRRLFCSGTKLPAAVAPSVSSLPAKTEVPVGSTCLMTKWVLEKFGVNSGSLSCFVPENVQSSKDRNYRNFFEGWLEVRIGFESRTSKALRDAFRRAYDNRLLRWGRLLEVLDCFAGDIAYHYCTPDEEGYSKLTTLMVTASIERMEFRDSPAAPGGEPSTDGEVITGLSVEEDLTLIGYVTQSGASSMGIRIEMQQNNDVKGSVFFVMVAVNEEGRPVKTVPKLDVSGCSPGLRTLISKSVIDFQARKENAKKMFSLVPPDEEESKFLHETWKQSLKEGKKVIWMQDTRLESTELIQPEALSRYNRAFGGLVSRKALELSFLTSQCFLKTLSPVLKGVDDIYFLQPLFVGEMVMMMSTVVWVAASEVQVQVEAYRVDPVSGDRKKTNVFNFRYGTVRRTQEENAPQEKLPSVFPKNYADCIAFIEARRRYMLRKATEKKP